MAELEVRLLRYFVAVAEHLSYTAAAAELHLSQPALSQAVQRLERDVGAVLLDRGTPGARWGLRLTAAGTALLPAARDVLRAAERAGQAARSAASPTTLRVGFGTSTPRELTSAALGAADDRSDLEVLLDFLPWGREEDVLASAVTDLTFVQAARGYRRPGSCVVALLEVPRVAAFRADHPLAAREVVEMGELAGEPIVDADSDRAYWLVDPRPDSSSPQAVGPPARTVEEMLAFVTAGRGMAITSASVASTNGTRDVTFVPILDLDPVVVHLLTAQTDGRPQVAHVAASVVSAAIGMRGHPPGRGPSGGGAPR